MSAKRAAAITSSCLALIAGFEGMSRRAIIPVPGDVPTICVGHTEGVRMGDTATTEQCMRWLSLDALSASIAVGRCTDVDLSTEQRDALTSLSFNVGGTAFCRSTLVKKLNAGDCFGAADEFPKWVKAGGVVYPGLVTRRYKERELFMKGCV